jgi:molecular chaperone GrpE (heat shock protein)
MSDQQNNEPVNTEPTNPPAPPAEPAAPSEGTDWKAEARKWEHRAKANNDAAKRLEEIEAAQRTAEEKAQHAAAEAEKRANAALERVARAELKAALTGVVSDPGSVVEDLNVSKFINESGDVDNEAVNAFKARYEGMFPQASKVPAPNPAQGTSGNPPKTIGDQIAAAEKAGDVREALRLKSQQLLHGAQG